MNNEARSYKCGRRTAVQFCTRSEHEDKCDTFQYAESAAGGSESQNMGIHGSHTVLRLTPYDPDVRIAATVYQNTSCNGYSSVIWIEEGKIGTGDTYSNIHESLVTTPVDPAIGIGSILLPQGTNYFLRTWEHADFKGRE